MHLVKTRVVRQSQAAANDVCELRRILRRPSAAIATTRRPPPLMAPASLSSPYKVLGTSAALMD